MTVRPRFSFALVIAIALLAALGVCLTTRGGTGLTNDSHAYLRIAGGMSARLHGTANADDVMSRRFPPGLPGLLVVGGAALRVPPEEAGRWINVACAFASTLLISAIVRRATAGRPGPMVVAAALFAASIGTLSTHVFLWSEPAFTLAMLAGVLTLDAFLRTGRYAWLLATAVLAALAIWFRYAAAALVLAQCLTVLWHAPRERFWRRGVDAVLLGLAPTLALAAWLGTGPGRGDVAGRDVAFVPIAGRRVEQALRTLGGWLFAGNDAKPIAYPLAVIAIALLVWAIARAIRSRNVTLALPWTFACAYPLFLIVSMSLFDPDTPLDPRILSPLHTMAIVLACATLGRATSRRWRIVIAAASLVIALQAWGATTYLIATGAGGMGYNGSKWQESPTVRFATTLPADAPLFTTHQVALRMILGHTTYDLPYRRTGASADPRKDVDARKQMNTLRKVLDAGGGSGYVVYVRRSVGKDKQYLEADELGKTFRVTRLAKLKDGEVYRIEERDRTTSGPTTTP